MGINLPRYNWPHVCLNCGGATYLEILPSKIIRTQSRRVGRTFGISIDIHVHDTLEFKADTYVCNDCKIKLQERLKTHRRKVVVSTIFLFILTTIIGINWMELSRFFGYQPWAALGFPILTMILFSMIVSNLQGFLGIKNRGIGIYLINWSPRQVYFGSRIFTQLFLSLNPDINAEHLPLGTTLFCPSEGACKSGCCIGVILMIIHGYVLLYLT